MNIKSFSWRSQFVFLVQRMWIYMKLSKVKKISHCSPTYRCPWSKGAFLYQCKLHSSHKFWWKCHPRSSAKWQLHLRVLAKRRNTRPSRIQTMIGSMMWSTLTTHDSITFIENTFLQRLKIGYNFIEWLVLWIIISFGSFKILRASLQLFHNAGRGDQLLEAAFGGKSKAIALWPHNQCVVTESPLKPNTIHCFNTLQ